MALDDVLIIWPELNKSEFVLLPLLLEPSKVSVGCSWWEWAARDEDDEDETFSLSFVVFNKFEEEGRFDDLKKKFL